MNTKKELEKKLLEMGKDGTITYEALNEILPENYDDPDKIEEIFEFLSRNNIEVLDEKQLYEKEEWIEKEAQKKIQELSTFSESELEGGEEEDTSESEEVTSIYLKEMGKYPLLTPERETELSKIIRGGF